MVWFLLDLDNSGKAAAQPLSAMAEGRSTATAGFQSEIAGGINGVRVIYFSTS
jgi:hypothetical protein